MSKERKSGAGKFVLGAVAGGALALLFAPQSGEETRKMLKKKMDNLIAKAKDIDTEEIVDTISLKIEELKEELADLDREKVIELARKKAEQIKNKANDLVDLAIEKGTPAVEKAAEDVRRQAIKVTKQVLKKLEASE